MAGADKGFFRQDYKFEFSPGSFLVQRQHGNKLVKCLQVIIDFSRDIKKEKNHKISANS